MLKEKNAIVTGGTSGLGKEIALCYAKNGANVCIVGTNETRAKSTVEELQKIGNGSQKFTYALINVADTELVKSEITRLQKEFGSIDILVNCAGVTRDKLLMKMTEEDWNTVLDVNLKSVFNFCGALVRPMMKARSGKIINVSSVIGLTGNPGQVNYSASKHGVVGLTRSLAQEVGTRNVNVNCIAPGFFKTPMTDVLTDGQKEAILKKVPMGRLGNPEELANVALFLASDLSSYITGQVITVDGGMLS